MASRQRSTGRLALIFVLGTILVLSTGVAFLYVGSALHLFGQNVVTPPGGGGVTTTATNANIPASVALTQKDAWSGSILSSSTSAKEDIINPSDFSKPLEGGLQGSSSTNLITSSSLYTPGTTLVIHGFYSGYYDNVQTFTVPAALTVISNTQNYYLGSMSLVKRATAGQLTAQLVDPSGAVDSSSTSLGTGGTLGSYAAPGGQKLNPFQVAVRDTTSQTSFAYPQPFLTSVFKQITLQGTLWLGVNSTSIGISALTGAGWTIISNEPTGWTVVYKQLPEIDSPTAANLGYNIQSFTIDTSAIASSKHLALWVWLGDMQNAADNALGVADGTLTAYGAYSNYGSTSVIGLTYVAPTSLTQAYSTSAEELGTVVTTG